MTDGRTFGQSNLSTVKVALQCVWVHRVCSVLLCSLTNYYRMAIGHQRFTYRLFNKNCVIPENFQYLATPPSLVQGCHWWLESGPPIGDSTSALTSLQNCCSVHEAREGLQFFLNTLFFMQILKLVESKNVLFTYAQFITAVGWRTYKIMKIYIIIKHPAATDEID